MGIIHGLLRCVPDKVHLQLQYYKRFRKFINFKDPKTFNEKLQWLKLHNRDPEYTKMVDKYAVRQYVAEKLGEEYLIPLLGVWDDPHDIDFEKLPDRFVLKWNHDSGSIIICRDKACFDTQAAIERLSKLRKHNGYNYGREWPYKNVKPKIICEQYLQDDDDGGLKDYKFFCFNGRADCVMVCLDRSSGNAKFYFFDKEWNLLRCNVRGKNAPEDFTIPKLSNMDEMFGIAEKLSQGLPFARIDLYSVSGRIYFGEITFFPDSGFDINLLPETDLHWGGMIDISKIDSEVKGND